MVVVPVIKAFVYEGREHHAGDAITVAPVVAAALARQGVVSLTVGYQPPAEAKPKRRRGYRRRDMVAE